MLIIEKVKNAGAKISLEISSFSWIIYVSTSVVTSIVLAEETINCTLSGKNVSSFAIETCIEGDSGK